MNSRWHAKHPIPRHATITQRIAWFVVTSLLCSAAQGKALPAQSPVCLDNQPSVQFEYEHSDAVLIGRVVGERKIPAAPGYFEGTSYTVGVRRLFRGQIAGSIEVFSENSES